MTKEYGSGAQPCFDNSETANAAKVLMAFAVEKVRQQLFNEHNTRRPAQRDGALSKAGYETILIAVSRPFGALTQREA